MDDAEWFEVQFSPELALKKYGIALPGLPSDDVQIGFTGLSGRANLQQAFGFYRYVRSACRLDRINEPLILDFGGGWGRISRFFLRDTKPQYIYIAETREYAIECLKATGTPCQVIHNTPLPPIEALSERFHLIYAYSVFSHLSEEYFNAWIRYFLGKLHPGGYLVFTTRGERFINHLEQVHREKDKKAHHELQEHLRRLREGMPAPDEIRRRYKSGDFQFYGIGGSGELTSDFFGEAFIPRGYIKKHFREFFVDFDEGVPNVGQSVVVLQMPLSEALLARLSKEKAKRHAIYASRSWQLTRPLRALRRAAGRWLGL